MPSGIARRPRVVNGLGLGEPRGLSNGIAGHACKNGLNNIKYIILLTLQLDANLSLLGRALSLLARQPLPAALRDRVGVGP